MRKFANTSEKINAILTVFRENEKDRLKGREIAEKLKEYGYVVDEGELKMFIYYYMLHKYLGKERKNGVNIYYPLWR